MYQFHHPIGATRNNPARRIHTNARKKHSCLLYAPNNSNRPPPPSPIKPIKPKPIPVVTEIRTYCPNINNNNSIINGDGNCKKIEQESDDDNNNNNGGKKRIIVIKNHCTIKPPVATFKSKKFEEIF